MEGMENQGRHGRVRKTGKGKEGRVGTESKEERNGNGRIRKAHNTQRWCREG